MLRLFAVLLILSCAITVSATENLVDNPGLEKPYLPLLSTGETINQQSEITGKIAKGWIDNSAWANVSIRYSEETENVRSGDSAQKVEVLEVRSGWAQFVFPLHLKKDSVYSVTFWARGAPGNSLKASLRKGPAPYTEFQVKIVHLNSGWQEFSFTARVSEDCEGYFMLVAYNPQEFWLDDVSIRDTTNAISEKPRKEGNLLPNGSFETGLSAGWSSRIRVFNNFASWNPVVFSDPRPVLDETTSAEGKCSLRVDIGKDAGILLSSPLVPYNYGQIHTASIALKADRDNVPFTLHFDGTSVSQKVMAGRNWRRYSVSGRLPFGEYIRLRVDCLSENTTVWMDGAMLEQAETPSPNYIPAHPVELGLSISNAGGIVFDGEHAVIRIKTDGLFPVKARLNLTVTDLYGKTLVLPTVNLPADQFRVQPISPQTRGVFKIRGQVVSLRGEKLSAPVECIFARLPRPREIAPEDSFFGVHIPLNPYYINLARATGSRWVRLHDASTLTKWALVQTQKDAPFAYFDAPLKAAKDAGLAILGMLDGAPAWASREPRATTGYYAVYNFPDIPDAMDYWEKYVRSMVRRYIGTIKYWEVWNEPWGASYFPVPSKKYGEEYGLLLKTAYRAAKEEYPDSVILGIGTSPAHAPYTIAALKSAGGSASYDIFSYHDYNAALYGGPDNPAIKYADAIRGLQAAHGEVKPVWNTEGGPERVESFYRPDGMGLSPRKQMSHVVRFDVSMMAAGVKKFFYYTLHSDPPQGATGYTALEHDRAIRPLLAARAVLASLVDGCGAPERQEPINGLDSFTYKRPDGSKVTVMWSYDGETHSVTLPKGTKALDVLGNPMQVVEGEVKVDTEPCYFVSR